MAFTVHSGGKGGRRPPLEPPTRPPLPPCTEQEIANAQHELREAVRKLPELLQVYSRLHTAAVRKDHDGALAWLQMLTGKWRHDHTLLNILSRWPTLRAPVKHAIDRLCETEPNEYTSRLAVVELAGAMTPEQIADLAGAVNELLARSRHRIDGDRHSTEATRARVQTITDALQYMTDVQIAALAPVVVAMIDATPQRTKRVRAALRDLLHFLCSVEDWVSVITSAVNAIRKDRT